jgi:hypothetical protein
MDTAYSSETLVNCYIHTTSLKAMFFTGTAIITSNPKLIIGDVKH